MRDLVAPPTLTIRNLVYPVFVGPGDGPAVPIAAMPGIERISAGRAVAFARALRDEGIRAVMLFGIPRRKDARGSEADADDSAVALATRAFREAAPEIVVLTDVCLCAYTDHGHCGVRRGDEVDNDATLDRLGSIAVAHARAGAEFVGPSSMMDHQVGAVRDALDRAGFSNVGILAYSAKLASAFYGPFREAEDSAPSFGDRAGYQIDPRRAGDALAAFARDAREGADILMVKPAMPALDLLARARERFDLPLAAYQVSGEYSMIRAAASRGWLDEPAAISESIGAIHRAGADLVLTYFARQIAAGAGAR